MKVKVLREKLKNTKRTIADFGDYVAVGSSMCHNLFSIDKKTLILSYALDTFNEGRKSLEKEKFEEGLVIWDTLSELIASGEIVDIINGIDTCENPIDVYTHKDGKIIKQQCEVFGWPNSTLCGDLMHKNTHYLSYEDALKDALNDQESYEKQLIERASKRRIELEEIECKLASVKRNLVKLKLERSKV